jgi:hypothetical protein
MRYTSLTLEQQYPYGIAKRALVAETRLTPIDLVQSLLPAIICIGAIPGATQNDPLQGDCGELLHSIISKGLKLPLDRVVVWDPAWGEAPFVRNASGAIASHGVLLLGALEEQPLGTPFLYNETWAIQSYSLQSIRESSDTKKAFWQHLQLILSRLALARPTNSIL